MAGNLTSAWSVAGGYAYTDAKFVADTSATLRAGGAVGQVPKHTFALWNRYEITPAWAAALGVIHRTKMFAANEQIATGGTSPNVTLPGYQVRDGRASVVYRRTTARPGQDGPCFCCTNCLHKAPLADTAVQAGLAEAARQAGFRADAALVIHGICGKCHFPAPRR